RPPDKLLQISLFSARLFQSGENPIGRNSPNFQDAFNMIPEEKRREILLIFIQPILSSAPVAMRKKKKTLRFSFPGSRCDAEPGFICTERGGRCAGRGGGEATCGRAVRSKASPQQSVRKPRQKETNVTEEEEEEEEEEDKPKGCRTD
ncbi:hypothetical protein NQZ68_015780, partial [Dissostichus eleginoides]